MTRRAVCRLIASLSLLCVQFAFADIAVLSDLVHTYDVAPGELHEGTIVVSNTGSVAARVEAYRADYSFSADGTTHFAEPGTLDRSNSDWIELGSGVMEIPPGETVEIRYRVAVPSEDRTGTYWSVVLVEEAPTEGTEAPAGGAAIRTALRYAVQVVTEFGGTATAMLEFQDPVLHSEGGHRLQVDVSNVGERLVRAEYYLELHDEQGAFVARVEGRRLRAYPGTSVRQSFDLGELQPGQYTALIVADGGGEDLFGAQYTLNIE